MSTPQRRRRFAPSSIPKRMAFALPSDCLSFVRFVNVVSFCRLHPGWQVRLFTTPGLFADPTFTHGDLPAHAATGQPPDEPIVCRGENYLKALRPARFPNLQIIGCDEKGALDLIAEEGGFFASPDILWLRPIDGDRAASAGDPCKFDSLYDDVVDCSLVTCFGPRRSASPDAPLSVAGPPGSQQFRGAVLRWACVRGAQHEAYLESLQKMPATEAASSADSEDGTGHAPQAPMTPRKPPPLKKTSRVTIIGRNDSLAFANVKTLSPWPTAGPDAIWSQCNTELPAETLGLNLYAADSAIGWRWHCFLNRSNWTEAHNCTWRRFASLLIESPFVLDTVISSLPLPPSSSREDS